MTNIDGLYTTASKKKAGKSDYDRYEAEYRSLRRLEKQPHRSKQENNQAHKLRSLLNTFENALDFDREEINKRKEMVESKLAL